MDNRVDHGGSVAIIGVACRFPGAAEPAEFHDLTVAGRRMFRPVTDSLQAALLDDWVQPLPFGDPEPGAQDTGPVQKLAAETTALALADAGFRDVAGMQPDGGRRSGGGRSGGGRSGGEGSGGGRAGGGRPEDGGRRAGGGMRRSAHGERHGSWSRAGLFIASSVAGVDGFVREQFGFGAEVASPGPAATSSLHAVTAAATALSAGDLDLAVAGGAELGLDPAWITAQVRAGTLGRDEMRVYAADPAGLLPGEGCGVVVLARSDDAKEAGLPVYAEITGWSTVPVSASSLDGQALLQAYQQAGIDPADIQLIEGEGTGTITGDLAELTAFAQLRRGGRATAALGAAAAGIGYTRAAAGIASLIKTALAMAAGMIPPGTGCARQHPLIESGDALLRLPRLPEPWPDGNAGPSGSRLAAVNSLGTTDPASGPAHNGRRETEGVHLVLGRQAEGDHRRGRRRRATETATPPPASTAAPVAPAAAVVPPGLAVPAAAPIPARPAVLTAAATAARAAPVRAVPGLGGEAPLGFGGHPSVFVLGGEDPGVVAGRLEVIAEGAAALSAGELHWLARQLALGVIAGPVRVGLTAATPAQLAARARSAARRLTAGAPIAAGIAGAAGIASAAGQARGAAGQARGAGERDVFVSAGAAGRVVVVFGGLAGPGLAQSARLAASIAGLRTLDAFGVRPGAAVGYSLGEITGLAWAGCLPWAEAARLAAQCGQVLRGCGCGSAAMARVGAGAETARGLGAPDRLTIAAYEGARSHVLAGPSAGIRSLTRRAAAAGVTVQVLDATYALHSPAMAGCAAPMRSVFAGSRFAPPRRQLISTITGRPVMPEDDLAGLLVRQLSQPVLFGQAMARAAEDADLIVIAGTDDGLADLAADCAATPCVTVPGGPAETDPVAGARMAAALFAAGAISDVGAFVTPATEPEDTLAGRLVPRMREADSAEASTSVRSG